MKKLILIASAILVGSLMLSGCSGSSIQYDEDEYQEALNDVGLNKTPDEIVAMIQNYRRNR